MLVSSHWLSVKFRIDFKIAVIGYKDVSGLAPKHISHLLVRYTSQRTLRSSNQFLLTVPRCRFKTKGSFTANAALSYWTYLKMGICFKSRVVSF